MLPLLPPLLPPPLPLLPPLLPPPLPLLLPLLLRLTPMLVVASGAAGPRHQAGRGRSPLIRGSAPSSAEEEEAAAKSDAAACACGLRADFPAAWSLSDRGGT